MKIISIGLIMLMCVSFAFSSVQYTPKGILFSYEAPNAEAVYLAGSFNDWNSTKTPMKKGSDGVWQTILRLDEGKHQYKFIVDGVWSFDQDNPNSEEDGYGGANSLIEVDKSGKIKSQQKEKSFIGIKAAFNPKVYFTGRYYTENNFIKNENYRYNLNKPIHDMNFGIKVKLNANFEAFSLMNINNGVENASLWKTHLNYKKSYIKMKTNLFSLKAFDNTNVVTFDDPMHILGNMGQYHYDFGYGQRGLYVETKQFNADNQFSKIPLSIKGELLFSDKAGSDESDVNAVRIKAYLDLNKNDNGYGFTIGSSSYKYNTRISDKIRQSHKSGEFDAKLQKYLYGNGWSDDMVFTLNSEYYFFENANHFDYYGYDPYIISSKYIWMNGTNSYYGFDVKFPKALKITTYFKNNSINFYKESEQTDPVYTPSPILNKAQLSRNTINLAADYELTDFKANINFSYWKTNYPDTLLNWADYYRYFEFSNGNGRWFEEYSNMSFNKMTLLGYKTALLWQTNLSMKRDLYKNMKLTTNLKTTFAHSKFMSQPKYIEMIYDIKLQFASNWIISENIRIPYYNDPVLNLKTDLKTGEDFFADNYAEIAYKVKKNIKLSLGFGVSPFALSDVTDEFYDGGRDEFLQNADNFMDYIQTSYKGVGEKIRNAENKLQNEQRISLKAVITF